MPPPLESVPAQHQNGGIVARYAVSGWRLWQIPRRAVILILAVDAAAILVPLTLTNGVSRSNIVAACSLAGLSISYSIVSRSWERARRALWESTDQPGGLYPNLLSVWRFAAAVMLPAPLAAVVVAIGAIADWPSMNITGQAQGYRYVYSSAGAVLATVLAGWCARLSLPAPAALGLAIVGYIVAGVLPIVLAQLAVGVRNGFSAFLRWHAHRLEIVTIVIALAQISLVNADLSMLVWISLPLTIGIHGFIVRQDLHDSEMASTRPMGEQSWLLVATEVMQACAVGSVLRVESRDPKVIRHLSRLKAGVDAVGAIGNSGFAVLMPHCPGENAEALAIRMRSILQRENVAAEIAVAAKPRDGRWLADLLAVTEAELITRDAATRHADSRDTQLD